MKRIAVVFILICFCFVGISFAGDAKLTQEQALIIKIEQLQGTIKYANDKMEAIKKQASEQYANFAMVSQQAQRDLKATEGRLRALEGKAAVK